MNTPTQNDTQHTQQQPLPFAEPLEGDAPSFDLLKAENDRLKETLRMRDAHDDLVHHLKKAGARTPKLLFEAVKHALKFTAEGILENAAETVDELRNRYPEQFRQDVYDSIGAGSGRAAAPTLTSETLAKMSPAEIAKLDWAEVQRVLSGK